jgi:hypothetical protein
MSQLSVDAVDKQSGSTLTLGGAGTTVQPHASATLSGFGKVLQVVQAVKTDTFSTASATMVEVTGFSASITPSSASNKILVLANVAFGSSNIGFYQLRRGGSEIAPAITASGYESSWSCLPNIDVTLVQPIIYLDSPLSVSSLTYSIYCRARSTSYVTCVNRTANDTSGQNYSVRNASYITLMEIEA